MKISVQNGKIRVFLDVFGNPMDRAYKDQLRMLHLFRYARADTCWTAPYDAAILLQLVDSFGKEALQTDEETAKLFKRVLRAEKKRLKTRLNFQNLKEQGTVDLSGYRFDAEPFGNHQRKALTCLKHTNVAALYFDCGLGKLSPLDEPVLTPLGWRPIGEIQVGDSVITVDGTSTEVIGVYPQGEQDIVSVKFNDRTSTRCGLDHLWAVRTDNQARRDEPWKVLPTRELMDSPLRYDRKDGEKGTLYWRIPLVEAVQGKEGYVPPVPPYVLGVILGDGSLTQGYLTFVSSHRHIRDKVENLLAGEHNLTVNKTSSKTAANCRISDGPYKTYFREAGLLGTYSYSKFIPPEYILDACPSDRLELLRGLLDTDGESSSGYVQYTTTSERLAEDVASLVRSLGGTSRISLKESPRYSYTGGIRTGRPCYMVQVRLPLDSGNPFTLPGKKDRYEERTKTAPCRKIVSIDPVGRAEAVCISVAHSSGLYLTRDYIVTHNTYTTLMWLRWIMDHHHPDLRALIVAPLQTLFSAWVEDTEKFAPDLTHVTFNRTTKKAKEELRNPDRNLWFVNFDKMRILRDQLVDMQFHAVIIDESLKIANSRAKTTKAAWALGDEAKYRAILSGMPAPNGELEYWAQLRFLSKRALGMSFLAFRDQYFSSGGFGGFTYALNPLLRDHFEDKLKQYCFRARTEDYIDLPPQIDHRIKVILPKRAMKVYKDYHDRSMANIKVARTDLLEGTIESGSETWFSSMILDKLIKLREICGGFLMKREAVWSDDKDRMIQEETIRDIHKAKVEAVQGLIEEIGPRPILVWGEFKYEFQMLKEAFPSAHIINSTVSQKQKEESLTAFKETEDGELLILLAHPKSVGHGLTFTNCRYNIFYSLGWSLDGFHQARKRTHRIGQDMPVHYYYLEACSLDREPTVDSVIFEKLQGKYQTQLELLDRLLELSYDNETT